jgi:hypothetical protein
VLRTSLRPYALYTLETGPFCRPTWLQSSIRDSENMPIAPSLDGMKLNKERRAFSSPPGHWSGRYKWTGHVGHVERTSIITVSGLAFLWSCMTLVHTEVHTGKPWLIWWCRTVVFAYREGKKERERNKETKRAEIFYFFLTFIYSPFSPPPTSFFYHCIFIPCTAFCKWAFRAVFPVRTEIILDNK